jgi:hypothetical protein
VTFMERSAPMLTFAAMVIGSIEFLGGRIMLPWRDRRHDGREGGGSAEPVG